MPSELRVRCFGGARHARRSIAPFSPAATARPPQDTPRDSLRGWNTRGDHRKVMASLAELVAQLSAEPSDCVVKVFVHRGEARSE